MGRALTKGDEGHHVLGDGSNGDQRALLALLKSGERRMQHVLGVSPSVAREHALRPLATGCTGARLARVRRLLLDSRVVADPRFEGRYWHAYVPPEPHAR